ncbi:MAG: putative quinol monooxygenase [Acidimicrobiales bacterium]
MIIIAGHLEYADRAARDEILAASADLQEATREDEPGCAAYCFSADPTDATRVLVYERWEDQASLAAHFEHPNYDEMRAVFHLFSRTGGEVKKYRCDLSEPVYDETGTIRADFFTASTPPGGDTAAG